MLRQSLHAFYENLRSHSSAAKEVHARYLSTPAISNRLSTTGSASAVPGG